MARYSKPKLGPWLAAIVVLCALGLIAVRLWQSAPMPNRPLSPRPVAPRLDAVAGGPELERPANEEQKQSLEQFEAPRFFVAAAPPVADRVVPVLAEAEVASGLPPVPDHDVALPMIATRAPRRFEPARGIELTVPRQTVLPKTEQGTWPRPEALLTQLAELESRAECAAWLSRLRAQLERLSRANALGDASVAAALSQLELLANEGPQLVSPTEDPALNSEIRRVCLGISRRVDIWRQVHQLTHDERTLIVSAGDRDLSDVLARVEPLVRSPEPLAGEWREYLLLDTLRLVSASDTGDPEARRQIARRVLNRMTAPTLSGDQRTFLAQKPFADLADRLRWWAYEPIDYVKFLEQIENCELRLAEGRTALVEDWQTLRWSPWRQTAELANRVDAYYRNANLRVAISADMLNRLLPEVQVMEEDVNDQILGARVNGHSMTFARLFVVLIPDRLNWRMGLVARGQVDSRTRSAKGPVTFFNTGATRYRARKLLTINRRGIQLDDAEAEAENFSRLTDVATEFDSLPLVGSLVRSIAIREHNERAHEANAQVEHKVGSRAAERLDAEVRRKLLEAEQRYETQLLEPLRRLHLNPVALEMQTTDQRLIVRYRVAANHQLAANTPRPQAPIDSLLSVQLHESTLNNVIGQLHLEGREISARDLFREITAAMGRPDLPVPEDIPDSVTVKFADVDPVRIRFADDHVLLSLRLAALRDGRKAWRDFEVHTRYAPVAQGRQVWLVRDDFIELRGGRLGSRDRIPLRFIFTTLMAKERKVPLVGPRLAEHPKLTDLSVTQLVLHDGWLGIAVGQLGRVANRPK